MKVVFIGQLNEAMLTSVSESGIEVINSCKSFHDFHDWAMGSEKRSAVKKVVILPFVLKKETIISDISEVMKTVSTFMRAEIHVICKSPEMYSFVDRKDLFPNVFSHVVQQSAGSFISILLSNNEVAAAKEDPIAPTFSEKPTDKFLETYPKAKVFGFLGVTRSAGVTTLMEFVASKVSKKNKLVGVVESPYRPPGIKARVKDLTHDYVDDLLSFGKIGSSSAVRKDNVLWLPVIKGRETADFSNILHSLSDAVKVGEIVFLDLGVFEDNRITKSIISSCTELFIVYDSSSEYLPAIPRFLTELGIKITVIMNKTGYLTESPANAPQGQDLVYVDQIDNRLVAKAASLSIPVSELPEARDTLSHCMRELSFLGGE